ncbi:Inosine-5'-monophosphate dehydrogenase [Aliiroseovarius sp. xm-m-379]|uniref:CBS domain-containing protein n=1 Tax=Aliiroseovarius crassostreae TaxID=154981 RepID=A0A9Q9HBQ2_9RHOB|nr:MULTISPECIES: CBS domain-containing protein [Aliiroseovarius]NRP12455.1 Inosine-5'-monophosphate dehydrogenase [Aliiroseovarius sp. xm-d-517]NRP24829.1 Inosine-5'-monophosphate dehydrogenase [Aliiroseovarius sp. xm-m-379]NRP30536.1 Inosine-5'-monophosphate dehydrogenase [Aliiroseovarius sp. xm-m-314]NRP33628.1 Inosine-5'-monophosphate dehydrogenase [Aliiroseovarius sp. xm-a-104]NRP40735.1 Inosine-5'-monophosphate dehydrogenase [Aliiroseovarius sp. xm-m-339-2]
MLVSQILKDKPISGVATIKPGSSITEAVALLSEKKIGAVIVSEDGVRPAGIVSERDVVSALGASGTGCLTDTVDSIMTAKLVSCAPGDRAIQVLQTMTEGRFRHMPVMEGDEMVGLVSIGDVVKARLDELSSQAEALTNMIMGY